MAREGAAPSWTGYWRRDPGDGVDGPASVESAGRMRRRVTFSRNLTLSLSRTCRCYCKYCAFATHKPHLHAPDEVRADPRRRGRAPSRQGAAGADRREAGGQRRGRGAAGRATATRTSPSYVVWACERALERGLLPHTNLGVLGREDLARLREVTASQGLMLESVSERLMEHRPRGLADQASGAADRDDRRRGRAEDPVHERDPRRDRRDRGGADRLAGGAGRAARAATATSRR